MSQNDVSLVSVRLQEKRYFWQSGYCMYELYLLAQALKGRHEETRNTCSGMLNLTRRYLISSRILQSFIISGVSRLSPSTSSLAIAIMDA